MQGEINLKRVPIPADLPLLPSWISAGDAGALRDVRLLFVIDGAARRVRVEGAIGVEDLSVHAPAITNDPIHLADVELEATADLDLALRHERERFVRKIVIAQLFQPGPG